MRFERRDSDATRTPDVDLEYAVRDSFENNKLAQLVIVLHANGSLSDQDIASLIDDRYRPSP